MEKTFKVGDYVVMKKPHACKTNKWLITRDGVDIKLKCINCSREIMMDRIEFKRKLKGVLDEKNK